ncbi:MAG: alpha/beta hydrolase, partial [Leptolyngbyaceae cyanobacterium RM1_1_2]|nr:alpha/beta hydrolase [Leptolyngbyaceae cyanobacterium RM1_1_2]
SYGGSDSSSRTRSAASCSRCPHLAPAALPSLGRCLTRLPRCLTLIAPAGIRDDSFVGRYSHLRPMLWETPLVDWALKAIAPLARLLNQQAAFEQIYQVRTELLKQPVAKSFLVDRLTPADAIDTVEQHLSAIAVPAQIIAAGLDSTIPLWHCQTYAEGIAGARLTVLPQAEHDLIQTHSDAIAELISQHASRHPSQQEAR